MQKPAVIFDLDGVLINSVPTHYRSLKKLAKRTWERGDRIMEFVSPTEG